MWDLSFPTRDQTQAPCSGTAQESSRHEKRFLSLRVAFKVVASLGPWVLVKAPEKTFTSESSFLVVPMYLLPSTPWGLWEILTGSHVLPQCPWAFLGLVRWWVLSLTQWIPSDILLSLSLVITLSRCVSRRFWHLHLIVMYKFCSRLHIQLRPAPGLPWWLSGKEPVCQCKRHEFSLWVGKISYAREQLSLCSGAHMPNNWSPCSTTREATTVRGLHTATRE